MGKIITRKVDARTDLGSHNLGQQTFDEQHLCAQGPTAHEGEPET